MTTPHRAWLLLPAGASLLAGLDAGLLRMGVPAPLDTAALPDVHGPLMVLGFLGTLIALERAVALRAAWGYASPVLLGLGGVALIAPVPLLLGRMLLLDGSVALVAVLVALWRRRRDDEVLVQVLAACLAVLAALAWVRVEASAVVPLLAGFVVLTIAAERVELARFHLPRTAGTTLLWLATGLTLAATWALVAPGPGSRAFGVALLALVAWLAPRDVARRTVRSTGLPRFSAVAMLAGYGWLTVAGASWAVTGAPTTRAAHDVLVHTVFLGFAMSMVLAHAPVILPAVLHVGIPYHPALYAPVALLQAALLVRVVAGDAWGWVPALQAGGVGAAAALILFGATAVTLSLRDGRIERSRARVTA